MNRTVEMRFHEEFSNAVGETMKASEAAIGYLSMWGINSAERYAGKVSIYGDRTGDLHGTYRNSNSEITYTIFGQRGEDGSYSFHS